MKYKALIKRNLDLSEIKLETVIRGIQQKRITPEQVLKLNAECLQNIKDAIERLDMEPE